MLSDLQFAAPLAALVVLLFLPALFRELRRGGSGRSAPFTGIEQLAGRSGKQARRTRVIRSLLFAGLLFLLALLWADPALQSASPLAESDQLARQKNLVLAIDVSRSMSGPLEMPDSAARFAAFANRTSLPEQRETRYEAARETVYRFVERFPDARIGLILFSTEPFLARWPTRETGQRFVEVLGEDLGGNSQLRRFAALTNTDAALELAKGVFEGLGSRGAVVHISDAEDELEHMGQAIRALRADGIRLYTIGVGISASVVTQLSQDFAGDPGFRIFRADSDEEMAEAYRLVAELEEAPHYAEGEKSYLIELRWLLASALVAYFLLLLWVQELALPLSQHRHVLARRSG